MDDNTRWRFFKNDKIYSSSRKTKIMFENYKWNKYIYTYTYFLSIELLWSFVCTRILVTISTTGLLHRIFIWRCRRTRVYDSKFLTSLVNSKRVVKSKALTRYFGSDDMTIVRVWIWRIRKPSITHDSTRIKIFSERR